MSKAYLRGLTQTEENQEGVDVFLQLDPSTRVFAFQFKAPQGKTDVFPYRYTLIRDQHDALFDLAQGCPQSVFYVLPFYVTVGKLYQDVPTLATDTWLLKVSGMPAQQLFGATQSKVIRCTPGVASTNPEYQLSPLLDMSITRDAGVPIRRFGEWYMQYRELRSRRSEHWRNPWLARGLRIAIVRS
jgi:hypothetical protein